jgi:hypothetical protein
MCPSLYLEDAKNTTCYAPAPPALWGHICWLNSTEHSQRCTEQCLFWQNFFKFRPEKYDFDLYKGLFMKKMIKICQISKKNNSNHQIFMISSIA